MAGETGLGPVTLGLGGLTGSITVNYPELPLNLAVSKMISSGKRVFKKNVNRAASLNLVCGSADRG